VVEELLGPVCYRRDVDELAGDVLSPYDTEQIAVALDDEEAIEYQRHREIYTAFLRRHRIRFDRRDGWQTFIGLCARMPDGRDAYSAYLEQKRITRRSRGKIRTLWALLRDNTEGRTIVFTADNDTAYAIGRQMCLPVITHHTKAAERKAFLESFRAGDYPVLVTSKVLNEGIDVPEANVGIIVSGSGSVREHVQRLGRLLRPRADKRAVLYELVSEGTSETYTSDRRRQHRAYQRPDPQPDR
jgi:superfamily II DNA or RNA helicase